MTTLRSRFALVAVVLVVPVLTGCGSNFNPPTDQIYTPARGVNDHSGLVDVLNTLVVSPSDGSGTVVATLVNGSDSDDRLLAVTVDGAPANVSAAAGGAAIPALGRNNLGATGAVSVVDASIVVGTFVDITFTFQHAEAITIEAPVVPNTGDYADVPVKQVR